MQKARCFYTGIIEAEKGLLARLPDGNYVRKFAAFFCAVPGLRPARQCTNQSDDFPPPHFDLHLQQRRSRESQFSAHAASVAATQWAGMSDGRSGSKGCLGGR